MKNLFFLVLGLIVVLGSIFLFFKSPLEDGYKTKVIKIGDISITADIANTPERRAEGLSGRKTLPEGTGMFFIFDKPDWYGFWMKNMNFAIDIIWIDGDLRIVDADKEVTPDTFPKIFYPNQAVKYVLELPAGSINKDRIDIGQVVFFD